MSSAHASALQTQDAKLKALGLTKIISENVSTYVRDLGSVSDKNPVLVLIHGYPQSSYMWRHLIPLLPKSAPLFVPDMPGYGATLPIEKMDKLSVGNALLKALKTQVKRSVLDAEKVKEIPVILIGHDRGARVVHRLTVSGFDDVKILGSCLIDIVPTSTAWKGCGNVKEVVGFFHWPLLANVELASDMISAYGGAKWVEKMISHWAGHNSKGLESLKSDDSLALYGAFFSDRSVVEASCRDYGAGATIDVEQQESDQKEGKKISKGTGLLLVYGGEYIGKRYDVPKEWEAWVEEGVEITDAPLKNGVGHFGAEEAPEETAEAIRVWLMGLGVDVE